MTKITTAIANATTQFSLQSFAFEKSQVTKDVVCLLILSSLGNIKDSDDKFLSDSNNDSGDAYTEEDLELFSNLEK